MKRFGGVVAILLGGLLLSAVPVGAVDQSLDLPVKAALEGGLAKDKLRPDIKLFMKGGNPPAVAQRLGEFESNKRSNALGKSPQAACEVAFISALISLQERAVQEGGNAVIDIYSVTKDRRSESADSYNCLAGRMVVNVALMGTVAHLAP